MKVLQKCKNGKYIRDDDRYVSFYGVVQICFVFFPELSILVSPDPRQHQPSTDVQPHLQSVPMERPTGSVGQSDDLNYSVVCTNERRSAEKVQENRISWTQYGDFNSDLEA